MRVLLTPSNSAFCPWGPAAGQGFRWRVGVAVGKELGLTLPFPLFTVGAGRGTGSPWLNLLLILLLALLVEKSKRSPWYS